MKNELDDYMSLLSDWHKILTNGDYHEVKDWAKTNLNGPTVFFGMFRGKALFLIRHEDDAALFALRWK